MTSGFPIPLPDNGKQNTKYARLAEALEARILAGEYPAGETLPTVRELMRAHGCSLATVTRALDILSSRGLVRVVHGRGVFVEAARAAPGAAAAPVGAPKGFDWARMRLGVVTTLRQTHAGDMWWTRILAGIDQVVRETGGGWQARILRADGREPPELVAQCVREGVNALVLLGDPWKPSSLLALARGCAENGIPAVSAWTSQPGPRPLHLVKTDNQIGIDEAVGHLAGLGHRRIGYLGPVASDYLWAEERRLAFLAAMKARGLDPAGELALTGPFVGRTPPEIESLARVCTAIVCANDDLAVALLRWAADHGVAVPGELSAVGFDDDPFYRSFELTTVHNDLERIGRECVLLLARLLDSGDPGMRFTLRLPARLVVRRTSAPPPPAASPTPKPKKRRP